MNVRDNPITGHSGYCECGACCRAGDELEATVVETCIRCGGELVSDEDLTTGVCVECWDDTDGNV